MPRLYMIGNAHLDVVWLWRWPEGLQEVKATFSSACDRIEEYDAFVFTAAGASYYKFVETNAPRLFERIRNHVREGRWCITGGWWLQPDCNLPEGESFVRHGLYGQRYFLDRFGVRARVGYNVDSFGHNGNLPQILKKSGLESYVFMRPGEHEKDLPQSLFRWRGCDGTEVMAFRIPPNYNQSSPWGWNIRDKVQGVSAMAEEQGNPLMCFYGVGNHGGGPTKETIETIEHLIAEGSVDLVFAGPDQYFAAMEEQWCRLPVVEDDLQYHAIGCYSAHSTIKRNNRRAEHRLLWAEKVSVLAEILTGLPVPKNELQEAWEGVLLNQFHDILGGCSIRDAYRDARDLHGHSCFLADRVANNALQSISWEVDTGQEGLPVVVFNPHPWPVSRVIEVNRPAERVEDDGGQECGFQLVEGDAFATQFGLKTAFRAELPPLGYRLYRLRGADKRMDPGRAPGIHPRWDRPLEMENGVLRANFDPESARLVSLVGRERGEEYLAQPGSRLLVIEDPSDTWSHGIQSYEGRTVEMTAEEIRVLEDGPLRTRIRTVHRRDSSFVRQDFILDAGSPFLECRVKIHWHGEQQVLKLELPVNIREGRLCYDIPYACMTKGTGGEERPAIKWADLTGAMPGVGGEHGLAVANRGKYGIDARGNRLRLTLLRSPIYAHHIPREPLKNERHDCIDQGEQEFCYLILPHAGDWRGSGLVRRAYELHQPPVPLIETYHRGSLPPAKSFLNVEPENVLATVLKQAEDNGDLILRVFEAEGKAARATFSFHLLDTDFELDFAPHELKTIRVPAGGGEAREVDLVEMDAREGSPEDGSE